MFKIHCFTCTQARHVVLASVFLFYFSPHVVRSSARNRSKLVREHATETPRRSGSHSVEKSYGRVRGFSNDAISSDFPTSPLLILFFLGICPTLRYRPLPLSAALIHG